MKLRTIITPILAIAVLAACSNDDAVPETATALNDGDVAYLSVKVQAQPGVLTRVDGSTEDAGDESDLKSLHLITFDTSGKAVRIPGTGAYVSVITADQNPTMTSPKAVKVDGSAAKLLIVANPGAKLGAVIADINGTTTYATINEAIQQVNMEEVTKKTDSGSGDLINGFAMINAGKEDGVQVGGKITDPLIDITTNIKKVSDYKGVESDAIKAAEANRVSVKIERLAAKVMLKVKDGITPADGGTFGFQNWTLTATNTTFYPFAQKTILGVAHTSAGLEGSYVNNFYTQDPNFDSGEGLAPVKLGTDLTPNVAPYDWYNSGDRAYCLENTMAADQQLFGNATRLIIKATYYPKGHKGTGDWFSFAGKVYADFATLKAAYAQAADGSNLKDACDRFYISIKAPATVKSFSDLEESHLASVKNGGEAVKDGNKPVVRWYQNGLCYYYYEIRHDNRKAAGEMEFGKYGVVRNNWYSLTLGAVTGPGTPWFPDPNNPGDGDPDPKDPLDKAAGYLGVTVNVAPWILWENEISIGS